MSAKKTGAVSAGKQASKHGVSGGAKRAGKKVPRRCLGRAKAERVEAVLDAHNALREPLDNAQYERFCQALLTAPNATQAAIIAGYSPATATTQACRLLRIVHIQRRLAGLFENTAHRSILRRRDVLKNASARASAAITDLSDLIGLPWEEFAEKIKHHPSAKAIKSVDMGRSYDAATSSWSPPYVKHLELFDPRSSERLLADLLGWEAPKRVELVEGYKGRIILPAQIPAPVGTLPEGFWEKDGGAAKGTEANPTGEGHAR